MSDTPVNVCTLLGDTFGWCALRLDNVLDERFTATCTRYLAPFVDEPVAARIFGISISGTRAAHVLSPPMGYVDLRNAGVALGEWASDQFSLSVRLNVLPLLVFKPGRLECSACLAAEAVEEYVVASVCSSKALVLLEGTLLDAWGRPAVALGREDLRTRFAAIVRRERSIRIAAGDRVAARPGREGVLYPLARWNDEIAADEPSRTIRLRHSGVPLKSCKLLLLTEGAGEAALTTPKTGWVDAMVRSVARDSPDGSGVEAIRASLRSNSALVVDTSASSRELVEGLQKWVLAV